MNRNFARVPYSYYFVDADAFGDWYDDYTTGREVSARDDASARIDRLAWISRTFKVPVGSEGGQHLVTPVLAVAEGIFMPVIGFGDPDLTTKGSPWYLGGYYPPDGPDVFLKPVPMKESYVHLFVDPRYRLPLYEAVFHDSVITSAHWSSSDLKFGNTRQTVALTAGSLPGCPAFPPQPRFLCGKQDLDPGERGHVRCHALVLLEVSAAIIPVPHRRSLVQESVFGELHLVANFRNGTFFLGDRVCRLEASWRAGEPRPGSTRP